MRVSIDKPDRIQLIEAEYGALYGCDQEWFSTPWQRLAGCGPSVAANILLYFQRAGRIKMPIDVKDKADFTELMEQVWQYVTPTAHGVYLLSQFCRGLSSICKNIQCSLQCDSLDIPEKVQDRPGLPAVIDFIAKGLGKDAPVAFLNLSKGTVKNLDEWHWVTVIALEVDQDINMAYLDVYDNSKSIKISLTEWYESTTLGGGFVFFA